MDKFETMEFNFAPNPHGDPFANIPMSDIDIGRESLPLLEISTSFGRESLGILKLGCDIDTRTINGDQFTNAISSNVFDQAFLLSSHSDLKSASTVKSSNFSFNFKGHDQLSPIKDFPSSLTNSTNILNDGFLYTTALSEKLLQQYRSRFRSLPVFAINDEIEKTSKQFADRASEGCINNCSILKEEGNEFNDSVFMEARHLATKFNDEGSKDGFILDDTDPPELINGDLENSNNTKEECEKFVKEDVFKKIDQLLPVNGLQQLNNKLDNRSSENLKQQDSGLAKEFDKNQSSVVDSPSEDIKKQVNAESDVTDNVKDAMNFSCSRTNTGEPDKILQALSMLLAKNNRSEKETEEGQCLLNTLSEMLSNNSKDRSKFVSNDSAKSVDGTNKLRSLSIKSQDASHMNSSSAENRSKTRKHSNSFSLPNKALKAKLTSSVMRSPSFDGSKTRNSVSSAESSVEIRNFSTENPSNNLKLKKATAAVRRGPMKATVPMENITKPRIKGTPTKLQQVMPKLKSRISTPVRDLQIKPMAQSTPDNKVNSCSSDMELTNVRSFSSTNTQEKSNCSSSTANASSHRESFLSKDRHQVSHLPRRNSVSEGRKTSTPDLKRSTSMKESSLMKAMNKIRQNISSSKGPLRDCSNMSSGESFSTSGKIITTPKRVMRAVGKENTSAVC